MYIDLQLIIKLFFKKSKFVTGNPYKNFSPMLKLQIKIKNNTKKEKLEKINRRHGKNKEIKKLENLNLKFKIETNKLYYKMYCNLGKLYYIDK
jgi:hypothetical protein